MEAKELPLEGLMLSVLEVVVSEWVELSNCLTNAVPQNESV